MKSLINRTPEGNVKSKKRKANKANRLLLYFLISTFCFLISSSSLAQETSGSGSALDPGALGTRSTSPLAPTSDRVPVGSSNLVQMVVALGVVAVALRYGLPKILRWSTKSGFGAKLDGEIRVIESRAITGGSLHLVRVRDKVLLIGATPQSLQLLADLTDAAAPIEETRPETAFENALQQASLRAVTVTSDERATIQENLRLATDRLKQMEAREP